MPHVIWTPLVGFEFLHPAQMLQFWKFKRKTWILNHVQMLTELQLKHTNTIVMKSNRTFTVHMIYLIQHLKRDI